MYSQEVYDIIARLRERIKDKSLDDDLNMLSLYSEMRSNALAEYEKKELFYKRQLNEMGDSLDSADAAMDMMDSINIRLRQRLRHSTTSSEKPSRPSFDDDDD